MSEQDPRKFFEAVQECWCIHQAMRQLGFSADDIYVAMAKDARAPHVPVSLFVVLKAQGEEFNVTLCGCSSEEEAEKVLEEWNRFVVLANEGAFDKKVLEEIYEASNIMQQKALFVAALYKKGIRPHEEWS
jgi:hypothetical protein